MARLFIRTNAIQIARASTMVAGSILLSQNCAWGAQFEHHPRHQQRVEIREAKQLARENRLDAGKLETSRKFSDLPRFSNHEFRNARRHDRIDFGFDNAKGRDKKFDNTGFSRANDTPVHILNHAMLESGNGRMLRLNSGIDIDLGSQERNIVLGGKLFQNGETVSIQSGDSTKNFNAGDQVTAAEYVAVKQVLAGKQTLVVDNQGRATGGQVDLSAITTRNDRIRVDDLSLPANLVTLGDFGKRSSFQVEGDLYNAGTLLATSSSSGNRRGEIKADNITNAATGLISAEGNVDLRLTAQDSLTNYGVISADNNLAIDAANVSNRGSIEAKSGNVVLDCSAPGTLSVDNNGGTISALNGSIALRNPGYHDDFNTYVYGGDLISKSLDVYAGRGTADISVHELTGQINETGLASHIEASTENLSLGEICLKGDPTYKNTTGSITFTGSITVAEALTVIAGGNITNSVPLTIQAGNANTGFPVTLIAGAEITSMGANTTTIPPLGAGVATTITGLGANNGGSILFNTDTGGSVTINTRSTAKSGNSNGGDVLLVAYRNNLMGGAIQLQGSFINTGGKGTGNNGDVTILAGGIDQNGFNAIETGTINTTGGSGSGGDVYIQAVVPTTAGGTDVTYNANGTLASGQILPGSVILNGAKVHVSGDITAPSNISILCGASSLDFVNIGDGVTVSTTRADGHVLLRALFSSDITAGTGSLVSTNTLELLTLDGDFGSAQNPIVTNAKYLIINGDNLTTDAFVTDINPLLINVDAVAFNLTLNTTGSLVQAAGTTLTATNLSINSGADLGASKLNPLEIFAFNLNLNSGGDAIVHNTYNGTTTINGPSGATGLFSFSCDGDLNSSAAVTADRVELETLQSFSNLTSAITGTTSISLVSDGGITNANVSGANMTTNLLKLTSLSGNVGVSAVSAFTLGNGVKGVEANGLNAFLQGPAGIKKGFKLAGGEVTAAFFFNGGGSTVITGDITTTNSDLQILTATGTLTINPNVHLTSGRNILLRVTDTGATASKSKVIFGKGAEIQTSAAAGFGNIAIAVGPIAGSPVAGTPPSKGVQFAENGGTIFWGQGGLRAKTPVNTLFTKNADITINNPFKASNISLGGDVKIVTSAP